MFRGQGSPPRMTGAGALSFSTAGESQLCVQVLNLQPTGVAMPGCLCLRRRDACPRAHNGAIHPASWLTTYWGPTQKQIKVYLFMRESVWGCSDWCLLEDEGRYATAVGDFLYRL